MTISNRYITLVEDTDKEVLWTRGDTDALQVAGDDEDEPEKGAAHATVTSEPKPKLELKAKAKGSRPYVRLLEATPKTADQRSPLSVVSQLRLRQEWPSKKRSRASTSLPPMRAGAALLQLSRARVKWSAMFVAAFSWRMPRSWVKSSSFYSVVETSSKGLGWASACRPKQCVLFVKEPSLGMHQHLPATEAKWAWSLSSSVTATSVPRRQRHAAIIAFTIVTISTWGLQIEWMHWASDWGMVMWWTFWARRILQTRRVSVPK